MVMHLQRRIQKKRPDAGKIRAYQNLRVQPNV